MVKAVSLICLYGDPQMLLPSALMSFKFDRFCDRNRMFMSKCRGLHVCDAAILCRVLFHKYYEPQGGEGWHVG